jgi:hypothetical protein
MGSILGGLVLDSTSQKVPCHRSLATTMIFFSAIDLIMMHLFAVAYSNSDWATCVKTGRSFSGICIQLVGGMIAYKTKFQPTVALSSTEAEFMAACNVGQMSLFIRSILWDLDILQEAATIAYEDNMDVLLWVMHRNLPPGHAISISNTLHFVIGLNVISSASNELTRLSTSPATSPNHSLGFYFTGTLITYLDISLLNIRRYINMPSQHTPTTKRVIIGTFPNHLRLP